MNVCVNNDLFHILFVVNNVLQIKYDQKLTLNIRGFIDILWRTLKYESILQ